VIPGTFGPARCVIAAMGLALSCATVPPLETLVRGGPGPPALVLLHGYGSSAEEWLPFTTTIQLPGGGRFVFPQGPGPGPGLGRGWWSMDLSAYRRADGLPDLSSDSPEGLAVAATRAGALVRGIRSSIGGPIAAGGFSQGGMVMSDVVFRSDTPIDALVLLSTTIVDEREWMDGYARRRGLPTFIAHGRRDPVLSYAIAERFQSALRDAGLDVTWHPFDGEHEIPAEVVAALNQFLARALTAR
jgi:phospholipase/carboxylesterase